MWSNEGDRGKMVPGLLLQGSHRMVGEEGRRELGAGCPGGIGWGAAQGREVPANRWLGSV